MRKILILLVLVLGASLTSCQKESNPCRNEIIDLYEEGNVKVLLEGIEFGELTEVRSKSNRYFINSCEVEGKNFTFINDSDSKTAVRVGGRIIQVPANSMTQFTYKKF